MCSVTFGSGGNDLCLPAAAPDAGLCHLPWPQGVSHPGSVHLHGVSAETLLYEPLHTLPGCRGCGPLEWPPFSLHVPLALPTHQAQPLANPNQAPL